MRFFCGLPLIKRRFKKLISPCYITIKYYSKYLGNWESPDGHVTGISIYNFFTHDKVPMLLKRKGIATWYMCGPTVYAESHIGHASCYMKFDIIRRIMETMFNIEVVTLMGITDVDDKIIQKSLKTNTSISQVSKKYELSFFEDMQMMRIKPPTITARVTDSIPLIISFCQKLIDKEYAYCTSEGNVYFIVSKGVSSDILVEMTEESSQVLDPLKRDQRDFALWKAAKPGEPFWTAPWGDGRPGWHIECSAMASNMFGSEIDIHSGGYDLIFPHHTNEKSQSEAYHGCQQWVNYWIHAGLLQVQDDIKMSKSLGNTISIKDFLKYNSVNDFRILCLQSLYRNNISFSTETLTGAKGLHRKLHNFINETEAYVSGKLSCSTIDESNLLKKLSDAKKNVRSSLASDFNTSQALLSLVDLIDHVNKLLQTHTRKDKETDSQNNVALSSCAIFVDEVLENLGVYINCKKRLPNSYVFVMDAIIEFRTHIRAFVLQKKAGNFFETNSQLSAIQSSYLTLHEQLNIMGINVTTNIKVFEEISEDNLLSLLSMELKKNLCEALKAVLIFYKEVSNFVDKIENCDDNSSYTVAQKDVEKKKSNKKLLPILKFCDDLRLQLEESGISVKDRGSDSTWFPAIIEKCQSVS